MGRDTGGYSLLELLLVMTISASSLALIAMPAEPESPDQLTPECKLDIRDVQQRAMEQLFYDISSEPTIC